MSLHRPGLVALVVSALCVVGCAQNSPPEAPGQDAAAVPAVASPADASRAEATPTPDTARTLAANQWQLESASDAAGQSIAAFFPAPDKQLGLLFADGRINVTGSCNRMSAGFELLDTAQMQVSPGPSTMMACPPPLAEADAAIASFLSGTLQVTVAGEDGAPQLQLAASDGRTLTFNGTPTPETRFGGPGTRAFLEVSPEPCVAPAPSTPPCLMVRDRHFDEKGLASMPPGEWRALPQGIEGYTPVAGEQHVVRVKRFEQAGATGSQPTEHFVLDLVIETRTVGS
jgi:heat shock protein HslJ